MKRLLWLMLFLLPNIARADFQYTIDWTEEEAPDSCEVAKLDFQGDSFFNVNSIPLPTYTVWSNDANTPTIGEHQSVFSSTLLQVGANNFAFAVHTVNNSDYCAHNHNTVLLESPGNLTKPLVLFDFYRLQMAFKGSTSLAFSLRQIDPFLADDIVREQKLFDIATDEIVANAQKASDTAAKLDRLASLEHDIDTLLQKSFDSITQGDIDAVFSQYSDFSSDIQQALDQLLIDLKSDIVSYRAQIATIVATFQAQINQVTHHIVTDGAIGAGFDPTNATNYTPQTDPSTVPDVQLPLVANDPFDPNHDPYAAYADQIMGKLNGTIVNGVVDNRAAFQEFVQAWRDNQNVVGQALKLRTGTSQKEWGAFLQAQQRVLSLIRQYMDDQGWYKDSPIPDELKLLVDGIMLARMAQQARALKGNLNLWVGPTPTPQQWMVIDTLNAILDGGLRSLDDGAGDEDPTTPSTVSQMVDGAIVVAKEVAKFGVYLTPVGEFIQICEVVTGKETCLPSGRDLSTAERIYSGLGMVVGSTKFWGAVGRVVRGGAKVASAESGAIMGVFRDAQQLAGCVASAGSTTSMAISLAANSAPPCPLGKLVSIGKSRWRSTAGLIYGLDPNPKMKNRVIHVLAHSVADPTKPKHSVFAVAKTQVLALIDEAWQLRTTPLPNDPGVFIIPMGNRIVGTAGQKSLRIVVIPGTSEIITAYPWP